MENYWNEKFDKLNNKFWAGKLKKIPVTVMYLEDTWGEYYHPTSSFPHTEQEIYISNELPTHQKTNILLHEMAHHFIYESHGDDFYHDHPKKWKDEMKRIGFKGKITKFTGRFKTKED